MNITGPRWHDDTAGGCPTSQQSGDSDGGMLRSRDGDREGLRDSFPAAVARCLRRLIPRPFFWVTGGCRPYYF